MIQFTVSFLFLSSPVILWTWNLGQKQCEYIMLHEHEDVQICSVSVNICLHVYTCCTVCILSVVYSGGL